MSNSTLDRDQARSDQAGRRSQDIRRATVKAPTTPSSLAEDRVFGRRAGFIGFSILAHLALLAGIMMNSNLIPALREIGGGDGQMQGAGTEAAGNNSGISIVEVSETGAPLSSPTNAGVMTDNASDVALPTEIPTEIPKKTPKETTIAKAETEKPKVISKSVQKPAPQKPAQQQLAPAIAVAPVQQTPPQAEDLRSEDLQTEEPATEPQQVDTSSTQTEDAVVATPVATSVPEGSTAETSEQADQETSQQEAPPTLLATPPGEAETEQSSQESNSAPVATAATANTPPQEAVEGDDEGGRGGSATQAEPAPGRGENGAGQGAGLVINGPIRDAGELRALPGNPNPVYPARDRLKRKEGTAVVLGQIQPDGRVSRVVLEKSSGSKEMDLESAKAFKNWRFQAGQAGWVRKPFQFRLVGNAKEVPAPLGEVLKRQSGALGK